MLDSSPRESRLVRLAALSAPRARFTSLTRPYRTGANRSSAWAPCIRHTAATRMILLRSLVFHAAFYLTTAALAILGLPFLAMSRHRVQDFAKFWTGSVVWLLEKICGTKIVW